jgi:hypothetical protein
MCLCWVGSNAIPITITLPPQFNTAPAVGLLLIDSIGCERFEEIYCITPTPTPTPIPCDTYWLFEGGPAGALIWALTKFTY